MRHHHRKRFASIMVITILGVFLLSTIIGSIVMYSGTDTSATVESNEDSIPYDEEVSDSMSGESLTGMAKDK